MSLREELERLRTENDALRQQLAEALAHIAELETQLKQRQEAPAFVKSSRKRPEGPRPPRKKRAAQHNGSRRREPPTRIERHALDRCPDCAYRLRGASVDYTRQVIELPPPPPVAVVEHQVIKRWCPHCQRWRSPRLDLQGQVLGQGRVGVRIASLIAYLQTSLRLPVRQIQAYLATLHDLHVSLGEIVALGRGVGQALQPQRMALRQAIRGSPVVHGDETGWREDGQNGYVWAFVRDGPEAIRDYTYDRSRSHQVVRQVLGAGFRGWLVSDFYGAYNFTAGPHQRCWVHLLRDLHELKETHAGEVAVQSWAEAVRSLYDEAQAWLTAHPQAAAAARQERYRDLFQRLYALGQQYAFDPGHPCQVLAKRLLRHQEELLGFVLVAGLPADNNLAERSLRPLVVLRKVSGGSRSPAGTETRMTLSSLLGTWAARRLNPFLECLAALQRPSPALS